MTAPDPTPSATLAGIRERYAIAVDPRFGSAWLGTRRDTTIKLACEDVPRLLAAVEAVLARHSPGRFIILGSLCTRHEQHRFFSITRTEAADVEACPDCPASVYVSCAGCGPQMRLDSCPDRAAITAELNGKE